MNETILVVEDEKNISDILVYGLKKEGFNVLCAYMGGDGYNIVEHNTPDLVLLDVMLPDISGVTVCEMIREQCDIPVIMLTALGSVPDRLQGLEAGADDYITKPFDIREVVARIKTVLRRSNTIAENIIRKDNNQEKCIDNIRIEQDTFRVYKDEQLVELTPKEFELLTYLVYHANIVFSRDMLLEQIWGFGYLGDTRTIDTHIMRLRKKLDWTDRIVTVYGVGYKFVL